MERIVLLDAEGYECGTDLDRGVMGWFFLPGGGMSFSLNVMSREYVMMKMRRKDNLRSPKMFGVICRKEWISNLKIAHEAGRSWVEDFFVTSKDGYGHLNCCDHIFGKSPKEAKRLYEELFQKMLSEANE